MTKKWKNDFVEAWTLEDGTLVVKRKVMSPESEPEFDHYFLVDTLPEIGND